MSSDRYRDKGDSQENRYGSGRREGRGVDDRTGYSGQIRQPWEPEQSERQEDGGYRTQNPSYAQPQGDGEPYEDNGRDRLSGGPARRSDEGERWPSAAGRSMGGSRSFDGRDRSPQNQSQTGGGYGEYNYRDQDSPRGRSMRGGYGQPGAGFGRIGATGLGQMDSSGQWGQPGRLSEYGNTSGEMGRGRFTGKGPKGYQRSDDRIREDVSDVLERHGEIDASDIEVQVQSGEVTLAGTVHDRFAKRLAEDVIENLSGIKQVHNRLRVGGAIPEKQNEARSKSNTGKPSGSMRQS